MKTLSIVTLFSLFALASVQAGTVKQARAAGVGQPVTLNEVLVTRIIDNPSRSHLYVEDATGGIAIYTTDNRDFVDFNNIKEGDVISFSGEMSEFSGVLQVSAPLAFISLDASGKPVEPKTIDISVLANGDADAEKLESKLIKLEGVQFDTPGVVITTTTTYHVFQKGNTQMVAPVRTVNGNAFSGDAPASPIDLVGIVGEYKGEYQLNLIRSSDILKSSAN